MNATHGLAAILRDARIGDARAPPRRAPQDEVGDRFANSQAGGGQPTGWVCCTIFIADRINGSSKRGPTIWIPTGSPSLVLPAGTLPPGRLIRGIRNEPALQAV